MARDLTTGFHADDGEFDGAGAMDSCWFPAAWSRSHARDGQEFGDVVDFGCVGDGTVLLCNFRPWSHIRWCLTEESRH